jgi:hypothetical protein
MRRLVDRVTRVLAYLACTAYNRCMQYTIRNVPDYLDSALRKSARELGKSLNEVAVQALVRGAGLSVRGQRQRDLSDIAGGWVEDPAFESALAEQDTVDQEIWLIRGSVRKKTAASLSARSKRTRKRTAA